MRLLTYSALDVHSEERNIFYSNWVDSMGTGMGRRVGGNVLNGKGVWPSEGGCGCRVLHRAERAGRYSGSRENITRVPLSCP